MTTYEMLWDCSSCGTNKLLGKTHRRCPQCGAPQIPSSRYFPAPGEEIEAGHHVFVGVDWLCGACTTPNSTAAACCIGCGNPRAGNDRVQVLADAQPGAPRASMRGSVSSSSASALAAKKTGRRSRAPLYAASVALCVLATILIAVFWQKDLQVRVEQHAWARDIDVERLDPRQESSWCPAPSDAYSVSHSREVRSTRQIPDGQTCHDVNHDNGDGTFSKSKSCSTRYRSEPVYDDKCHYSVDRWHVITTAHNAGGLTSPRSWPALSLGQTGSCRGCQREGARRELLEVALRSTADAAKTWRCPLEEARWQRLKDGDLRTVRVRVVTGGIVCSTLVP